MSVTLSTSSVLDCAARRWSPGIGDPSLMGWVTVLAYALIALLAFSAMPASRSRRESWFWILTGLLLLAMAANKQLDLQSALTAVGRCVAQLQGWYGERRMVQREFIMALLTASALVALGLVWTLRASLGRIWLGLLGVLIVMTFVAVRAISFHHMDAVLHARIHDIRVNWILELSGLILISLNVLALRLGHMVRHFRS